MADRKSRRVRFAAVNHETVVVAAGSDVHFAEGVEIKSPTVSVLSRFEKSHPPHCKGVYKLQRYLRTKFDGRMP